MPYKHKADKAKQMRRYRLRKAPLKKSIREVKRVFARAFAHALFYPQKFDSMKSAWIHTLTYSPFHNSSVKVQLSELENILLSIDNMIWKIRPTQVNPELEIPREHEKLFIEEQNILHDLYERTKKGEVIFKGKEIAEGWLFPLPLDEILIHDEGENSPIQSQETTNKKMNNYAPKNS